MNPDSCQASSCFHFLCRQLFLAFSECWNSQPTTRSSPILMPRSAIISSSGSTFNKKPLCSVITLSETCPPRASETKPIERVGGTPIKTFAVLCFFVLTIMSQP